MKRLTLTYILRADCGIFVSVTEGRHLTPTDRGTDKTAKKKEREREKAN